MMRGLGWGGLEPQGTAVSVEADSPLKKGGRVSTAGLHSRVLTCAKNHI